VLVTCPAKCVADTERRVIHDSTKGRSCEMCRSRLLGRFFQSRSYKCPNRVLLAFIARDGHFPRAFARRDALGWIFPARQRRKSPERVPNLYRSVTIVSQAARFRQMRRMHLPMRKGERERERSKSGANGPSVSWGVNFGHPLQGDEPSKG
jgi:hypothetical protein